MKFKFVVKFGVGRTKGDIEALADARRALKNQTFWLCFEKKNSFYYKNWTKHQVGILSQGTWALVRPHKPHKTFQYSLCFLQTFWKNDSMQGPFSILKSSLLYAKLAIFDICLNNCLLCVERITVFSGTFSLSHILPQKSQTILMITLTILINTISMMVVRMM